MEIYILFFSLVLSLHLSIYLSMSISPMSIVGSLKPMAEHWCGGWWEIRSNSVQCTKQCAQKSLFLSPFSSANTCKHPLHTKSNFHFNTILFGRIIGKFYNLIIARLFLLEIFHFAFAMTAFFTLRILFSMHLLHRSFKLLTYTYKIFECIKHSVNRCNVQTPSYQVPIEPNGFLRLMCWRRCCFCALDNDPNNSTEENP